ncbi:hypothetical protein [Porticoccus sp.]
MTLKDKDPLATRTGPSFGFTLIPSLIHHLNPLAVEGAPPLPAPDTIGTLPAADIATLYAITLFPQQKWSISGYNSLDQTLYTNFINFKTQLVPSYYTAYQQTLALYKVLVQELGGADKAMDYLYTPNPTTPPQDWDVARNWAIKEFLLLFVISGNFRAYEWLNFPGWMGSGPFNDPNHLPYRGINYAE